MGGRREVRERDWSGQRGQKIVLCAMDAEIEVGTVVEVDTLLRMGSIATQIDNKVARNLSGKQGAMCLFDESKRHVDPGGDTGAGNDASIAHKEHRLLDLGTCVTTAEERRCLPVCGTAPTI